MTKHFHLTEIKAAFDAMEARLGMKVIIHHN